MDFLLNVAIGISVGVVLTIIAYAALRKRNPELENKVDSETDKVYRQSIQVAHETIQHLGTLLHKSTPIEEKPKDSGT